MEMTLYILSVNSSNSSNSFQTFFKLLIVSMGKTRKAKSNQITTTHTCNDCDILKTQIKMLEFKLDETFKQCLDQARLLKLLDACDSDEQPDHATMVCQMERDVYDLQTEVHQLKSELSTTRQKLSASTQRMEQVEQENIQLTKEIQALRQYYVEDVEMFIRACERAWEIRSVELAPEEMKTLEDLRKLISNKFT